ncbi:MAG TPA: DivIVA domain-containing protein, partial [Microthrixaceae bacterium]|nr:DivIVA domain-containing protein [Microthrixaceae bacterium]
MDVTPQLIEQIDFAEKFRGYDPDQVDDFLERVGATLAELTKTSRDAIARAERAEAELRNAPEAGRAPAAAAAAMSDEEEAMQSTRTLMMAKRTADAAIADARQEAQKLVADARTAAEQQAREARTEADRIVGEARVNADQMTQKATAEANREYGARRDQILAEIGELENRKVGMASQLVAIEGRLEEYRSALTSVHGAIGAVLDDPETALRSPLPGIDLAGIVRPVAEPVPEPDVAPADVASSDDAPFDAAPYEPAVFAPVADVAPDARSFDTEPSYAEPIGEPAFTDSPFGEPVGSEPAFADAAFSEPAFSDAGFADVAFSDDDPAFRNGSSGSHFGEATLLDPNDLAVPYSEETELAGGADLPWSDDRLDDRADEAPVGDPWGPGSWGEVASFPDSSAAFAPEGEVYEREATATTASHAFTEF